MIRSFRASSRAGPAAAAQRKRGTRIPLAKAFAMLMAVLMVLYTLVLVRMYTGTTQMKSVSSTSSWHARRTIDDNGEMPRDGQAQEVFENAKLLRADPPTSTVQHNQPSSTTHRHQVVEHPTTTQQPQVSPSPRPPPSQRIPPQGFSTLAYRVLL